MNGVKKEMIQGKGMCASGGGGSAGPLGRWASAATMDSLWQQMAQQGGAEAAGFQPHSPSPAYSHPDASPPGAVPFSRFPGDQSKQVHRPGRTPVTCRVEDRLLHLPARALPCREWRDRLRLLWLSRGMDGTSIIAVPHILLLYLRACHAGHRCHGGLAIAGPVDTLSSSLIASTLQVPRKLRLRLRSQCISDLATPEVEAEVPLWLSTFAPALPGEVVPLQRLLSEDGYPCQSFRRKAPVSIRSDISQVHALPATCVALCMRCPQF